MAHEPVLKEEVIRFLSSRPIGCYIDCNLGQGGHSLALLQELGNGESKVVALDADPEACSAARTRIANAGIDPSRYEILNANHSALGITLLNQAQLQPPLGVLYDLGPSSTQLLDMSRGMSFESDESLDMRYSRTEGTTAEEIVNEWAEEDLANLFWKRADEKFNRRIARRIVEARETKRITTGRQLASIVAGAVPRAAWPKIHVASKVFMALRMEVTQELESFEASLPQALDILAPGGLLLLITFDGSQDVIAKNFFREMGKEKFDAPFPLPQSAGNRVAPRLKVLTPKPVTPSEEEISRNPRSRSARLRVAEKIG